MSFYAKQRLIRLRLTQQLLMDVLQDNVERELTPTERNYIQVTLTMNHGISIDTANEHIRTCLLWLRSGVAQAKSEAQQQLQKLREAKPSDD